MANHLNLAAFEEKLLDLQEQILGVTDLVAEAAQPVALDQNRVGRLSRMDAMAQSSVNRQRFQLKQIEIALDRIDVGDFGRCLECDEWIAEDRLAVDPTARHCIACASTLEPA